MAAVAKNLTEKYSIVRNVSDGKHWLKTTTSVKKYTGKFLAYIGEKHCTVIYWQVKSTLLSRGRTAFFCFFLYSSQQRKTVKAVWLHEEASLRVFN